MLMKTFIKVWGVLTGWVDQVMCFCFLQIPPPTRVLAPSSILLLKTQLFKNAPVYHFLLSCQNLYSYSVIFGEKIYSKVSCRCYKISMCFSTAISYRMILPVVSRKIKIHFEKIQLSQRPTGLPAMALDWNMLRLTTMTEFSSGEDGLVGFVDGDVAYVEWC